MGGEALKRRLVHGVALIIITGSWCCINNYNFVLLFKSLIAKCTEVYSLFENKIYMFVRYYVIL